MVLPYAKSRNKNSEMSTFKNFKPSDDLGTQQLAKSSVVRGIKSSIVEHFPRLEGVIDDIFPKKEAVYLVKGKGDFAFMSFAISEKGEILFFQDKDKPWLPSLRVVHRYPSMLPKMQVDTGAIKFVMRGAHIMAPGLTSAGGQIEAGVSVGSPVQITGEGCSHACAIGIMSMSSEDLQSKPTGQAIESFHCLNDGLWKNSTK
jgi:malignant T-cell-amplified sequence